MTTRVLFAGPKLTSGPPCTVLFARPELTTRVLFARPQLTTRVLFARPELTTQVLFARLELTI